MPGNGNPLPGIFIGDAVLLSHDGALVLMNVMKKDSSKKTLVLFIVGLSLIIGHLLLSLINKHEQNKNILFIVRGYSVLDKVDQLKKVPSTTDDKKLRIQLACKITREIKDLLVDSPYQRAFVDTILRLLVERPDDPRLGALVFFQLGELEKEEGRLLGIAVERAMRRQIMFSYFICLFSMFSGCILTALFATHLQSINRRKVMNEEIRQSIDKMHSAREVAEAASRSRDQFLAVLSHELRTPLTPCLFLASSLCDSSDVPDDMRSHFRMFKRNLELEARLIDDCLDMMMILKSKMNFRWEIIDAHTKIDLAVGICRPDIEDKNLNIKLHLKATQHYVNADAARFQQVIWNLVKNAVKYTPTGGCICVKTYNGSNGDLAVEISDSGVGMTPEIIEHAFDAFSQGEYNLGRQFGGLGLGLAISKAIVEGHRGRIEVSSKGLGEGSCFTVYLPVTYVPSKMLNNIVDPVPVESPKGCRIFLVEDDSSTRNTMTSILQILGHKVESAASLAEALAFDPDKYDLLLSDIGLGDGTGFDLMEQVRLRSNIPGIALTGYGQEKDILRSHEVGFAAHLTKPIDVHKLQETIERVTSS